LNLEVFQPQIKSIEMEGETPDLQTSLAEAAMVPTQSIFSLSIFKRDLRNHFPSFYLLRFPRR